MSKSTVTIMLRTTRKGGKRSYHTAVVTKGRVKPFYGVVAGKPKELLGSTYYLRFQSEGKRTWERVGEDPQLAVTAKLKREFQLASAELGLEAPPSSNARPTPSTPPDDGGKGKLKLQIAFDNYINDISIRKSWKTGSGYKHDIGTFVSSCVKTYMEDLDSGDVVRYIQHLRAKGNKERTVHNRVAALRSFCRASGFPAVVKKEHLVDFTEKKVSPYTREELKAIFSVCDDETRLLYRFFVSTGGREQEVMYACWSDIDFDTCAYTIKAKPDLGWTLKDREERTIPLPSALIAELKTRRIANPDARFIFGLPSGKVDGHMLRKFKVAAWQADLNCGFCISRKGKTCRSGPYCSRYILHTLRKTFAFMHSESGVSPRTLMEWLGHSDLETTLRYLSAADHRSPRVRAQVENTFIGFV